MADKNELADVDFTLIKAFGILDANKTGSIDVK